MKVAKIKEKNIVWLDELETPTPKEGEVLIKMKACGICGSDLEKIYGDYGMISKRIGHEPSGEVVKVGEGVTNLTIGDRVFVHHHVSCMVCYYCRSGANTMCDIYSETNLEPCGLSEYILIPRYNIERGGIIKLPFSLSFDLASLIEPLACCIRALNKCRINIGDKVGIFGAGPTGLMHLILVNMLGASKVILVDINDYRLSYGARYGAETVNSKGQNLDQEIYNLTYNIGLDLSIVATSNVQAVNEAINVTRRGGKVLLFGVPDKKTQLQINLNTIYSREITIIPSYAATEIETNQAIDMLVKNREKFDRLITHKFDLSDITNAIALAKDAKNAMKVIVIN